MTEKINVFIYGDSLMKATSPDDSMRLRFNIKTYLDKLSALFSINVVNRAHFGATVFKGISFLHKDLDTGLPADSSVLLEFGGNDCDYIWEDVSARPNDAHEPKVPLPQFLETLATMVTLVRDAGSKPILMTNPPISAEKYLAFITRNGLSAENILRWLGDVQEIYRFHEFYSNAIAGLARKLDVDLVDVRQHFLDRHDFNSLVSIDGIHPTLKGYDIICDAFSKHLSIKMA